MQRRTDFEEEARLVIEDFQRLTGETVSPPIPVKVIAEKALDFVVIFRPLEGQASALLHLDKRLIEINSADSPGRQRFSIAHEIGHIRLHSKQVDLETPPIPGLFGDYSAPHVCRIDNREWWEVEANKFAAALLMPVYLLRAEVKRERLHFEGWSLGVGQILKAVTSRLAGRFITSLEAMHIRLKDTGLASELFMDRLL